MKPMRLKCVACDALARPIYLAAARSPHMVDITLQHFGLHLSPKKLRESLQIEIDRAAEAGIYDAVILAYGLCGKATEGLRAVDIPLVLPRAHDCITLFLGSRERYDSEFQTCPGTYWYVQDFIERGESDEFPLSIGANTSANADAVYADYVEKYGKDNADYLMEAMSAWQSHYERAVYIDTGSDGEDPAAQRAQTDATQNGWRFERLAGDLVLIKELLDGHWDVDFLTLSPGQQVQMIGGEEIIRAVD
jgi:hypothetical protein